MCLSKLLLSLHVELSAVPQRLERVAILLVLGAILCAVQNELLGLRTGNATINLYTSFPIKLVSVARRSRRILVGSKPSITLYINFAKRE